MVLRLCLQVNPFPSVIFAFHIHISRIPHFWVKGSHNPTCEATAICRPYNDLEVATPNRISMCDLQAAI